MSGGYLTLDLRKLKDRNDKIVKKGIYKYITKTKKPIRVILPEWFINYVISTETEVKFLGSTYEIELTLVSASSDFGYDDYGVYLPIFSSYKNNATLNDDYNYFNKYYINISKEDELSLGSF